MSRSEDEAGMAEKIVADLLIHPIGTLVTPTLPSGSGPLRGAEMSSVKKIDDAAIAIKDGKIACWGPASEVLPRLDGTKGTKVLDASGKLVTPGLVDPHTHLVFGGNRAGEFMMRCQGKSYAEIASAGGGIVASMRGTRGADLETLVATGLERLSRMLRHGTTTCEIKTGYGLDEESELRMLEAILVLSEAQPVEIVPTFLPAHAVPPGMERADYVKQVVSEIMPASLDLLERKGVAPSDLFVDVFCDKGYFTLEDTKNIFEAARRMGMKLKVHSDEFESLGATKLACEMNAFSADHLLAVTDDDIGRLADSDTVAVLLPGTSFFLNLKEHAPARKLIAKGAAVAVGSDYNPGSCHIFSMPFMIGLACLHLSLTPEEALSAVTINAAYAIGRGESVGLIEEGFQGDVVVWDLPRIEEIPYNMGWNPIVACVKKGVPYDFR